MIRLQIAAAALALIAALSGAAWYAWQRVDHWKEQAEAAQARERAARAAIILLQREIASDAEIDAIPDDGLGGAVDPRWMLAPPAK